MRPTFPYHVWNAVRKMNCTRNCAKSYSGLSTMRLTVLYVDGKTMVTLHCFITNIKAVGLKNSFCIRLVTFDFYSGYVGLVDPCVDKHQNHN